MIRPTDQEMIAIEKIVCYSHFTRDGGALHHRGPHKEALGSVRGQRERGTLSPEPLLWFLQEGKSKAG